MAARIRWIARTRWIVVAAAAVLCASAVALGSTGRHAQRPNDINAQLDSGARPIVTISGDDGIGGSIDLVNVWNDYQSRSRIVARLHPGDKVTLIRRDGKGAQIETAAGTRGWVTDFFIKELQ
jgi:SH3-like domain-containing protein